MIKAHEIKLYPTKTQEIFFKKSCGVRRFAFNWALNKWNKLYLKGENTSAYSLVKHLNSIKRTEFVWMQETAKTCSQYAIHAVEAAWKNYFRELKKGNKNIGKPKFKKKGYCKDGFVAVENKEQFKQKDFKIWIPRLGWVKCSENLRFSGKVNNISVKRIANMWFAVVNIEVIPKEAFTINENQVIVGVDLGIKSMAVTSNGRVYENPKALKKGLRNLKHQQRLLARKVKGSSNRQKQQIKIARAHYKIVCIRKNALHKASNEIVGNADVIVLEDLQVKNMVKNHNLAQAINDVSFSELRRQIEYKAEWASKEVIITDKWFASSKICCGCGHKKEHLTLSERIYKCDNCGLEIDRDENAAHNLANYGTLLKPNGSKSCGEGSSVISEMVLFSPSVKQEIVQINTNFN